MKSIKLKLQFWSMDMIFSLVIFTAAIAILSIAWTSITEQYAVSYGLGTGLMELQAQSLVQNLQFHGVPTDWNSAIAVNSVSTWSNVSVGLEGNSGEISTAKVLALAAMSNYNYQDTKQLLGVGFDYYVVVDAPGQFNVSIGMSPYTRNATAIQTASVPVVLDNGDPAIMEVSVWTNTTFGVG